MIKADAHFVDCAKEGLTDVHNWSTPSSGVYTEYFVGFNRASGSGTVLVNATNQASVDTTFGVNGYWGMTGLSYTRDGVQLDDGRILVPHNSNTVTMVNTDGTTDTTWGTNGSYSTNEIEIHKVLVDNDGNFHLFGGVASTGAVEAYEKISADGVYISGIAASVTSINSFNDAQWSDSTKTRIIAGGNPVNRQIVDSVSYYPDLIAINPATVAIDTTWTGNIGKAGYFISGSYPAPDAKNIRILTDGGIVLHRNNSTLLIKVLSDGTGLDTSWGVNGGIEFANYTSFGYGDAREVDNYGNDVFVISRINDGGIQVYFNHIDSTGTIIDTYHDVGAVQYTWTNLAVLNDKLILGGIGTGARNNIEIWSQDFVKESGFDLAVSVTSVMYVLADETSLDYVYGTQARTVRYPADLSHLEGQTVQILADGEVWPDEVVTGGTVSAYATATNVHAGLGYTSTLLPMKLDGEANVKRISKIVLNVNNSVGGNYGRVLTDLYSTVLKPTGDVMDVDGDLYTGLVELPFDGAYDRSGDIYITQDKCVPMRVVGMGVYLSKEAI